MRNKPANLLATPLGKSLNKVVEVGGRQLLKRLSSLLSKKDNNATITNAVEKTRSCV